MGVFTTENSKITPNYSFAFVSNARTSSASNRQNEERLKLGASWHHNDLVFPSEIGTSLNPPNVTRAFKKILAKANIRTSIRLYDLRRTTATLLLQAGVNPKVVSERLGHSTIVLTLDVYSHVLPTMQQDATVRLEKMIFGKTGT